MESFWLCDDCLFATAYEDYSTLSLYYMTDEIEKRIAGLDLGLVRLMPSVPTSTPKLAVA
ncbi:hypothetical protein PHLH3_21940 [Pseudomonas sp. St386]|nr:hypothetical protein PHLH3_21940 [Pseudomonas sp. St386]